MDYDNPADEHYQIGLVLQEGFRETCWNLINMLSVAEDVNENFDLQEFDVLAKRFVKYMEIKKTMKLLEEIWNSS